MGFTRKNTPERLDKIIQFIHLYQAEHDGESPKRRAIVNEVLPDAHESAATYFISLLVDDNRLERVSSRPFRVRILDHPKNRAAIRRLEKALEAARELEAAPAPKTEPDPIPEAEVDRILNEAVAPSEPTVQPTERLASAHRAFADELDPKPSHADKMQAAAIDYLKNSTTITERLKFVESRDLLFELVERGYSVSKRR